MQRPLIHSCVDSCGRTAARFRDRVAAILRAPSSKLRLRCRAAAAVASAGALQFALTLPASAEEPMLVQECPSREAVAVAVRGLLRQSHVELGHVETAIEIRDMGTRYSVAIRGRSREYDDEQRDCLRRARVAGVFVALTIAPPDIALPALEEEPAQPSGPPTATIPPAAPAATVTAPTRPASSPAPWQLGIELGALVAVAPRNDSSLLALGAEGRVVAMRPGWGLTLGGRVATADNLMLGSSRIRQLRYPFDLGLRWQRGYAWLRGSVDLGTSIAVLQLRQMNSMPSSSRTLVEVGVRTAATLMVSQSPVMPYVRGFAEFFPFPRELAVEPRGSIGSTSSIWFGAAIGLAGYFN